MKSSRMKKVRVAHTTKYWPIDPMDRTPLFVTEYQYEEVTPARVSWLFWLVMATASLGVAGVVFLFVL